MINAIREYAKAGTQHIITLIDSELPTMPDGSRFQFVEGEIIRTLHDDGDDGLLFRMPPG